MYKIPLQDLKSKILESGKLSETDLDARIKSKINELSGLISEEGAAYIIANELGVEVMRRGDEQLKIRELYPGMRGISTVGKVVRKFEVREFPKGDSMGKVCSMVLGDETGTARLVFWNEQVATAEKVKDNDIIEVKLASVRENRGNKEIHLGERSEVLVNPPNQQVEAVRSGISPERQFERKAINLLQGGEEGVELLATIIRVFDPRFFTVCPSCGKRVQESPEGSACPAHGQVQPTVSYVLTIILDDGSETIRGVFWKNQVNHLLGKGEEQLLHFKDNPAAFDEIKTDLLGEQLKVRGHVKKNEMFGRLDFNIQFVERANPEEELARLEGKSN